MTHYKSILSVFSPLAVATILVAGSGDARAQPESMMISPGGNAPVATDSGQDSAPAADPSAAGAADELSGNEGIDYGNFLDLDDEHLERRKHSGTLPKTHTVVTGDTLWELSAHYLKDAWQWPTLWKLNPEIKDPHWIYPGNVVRLADGADVAQSQSMLGKTGIVGGPSSRSHASFGLRQTAYVDLKNLKDAGLIVGSIDAKSLLATGDSVYLEYGGKVPEAGTTFAVYGPGKQMKRDDTVIGEYVEIAGEVRVTFAKAGKRARAVVTRSVNPIERGMRVGPLNLNFSKTKPVVSDRKMDGSVIGLIGPDELIGSDAAVLLDRGSEDGVKVGNRFLVVRRGDAYRRVMRPGSNVGQDDADYPARAIAEIMVVQAGEHGSLGIVTFSMQEFGIGDRVYMRKGQ